MGRRRRRTDDDVSRARGDDIVERSIAHFEKADPECGARVREAVEKLRA